MSVVTFDQVETIAASIADTGHREPPSYTDSRTWKGHHVLRPTEDGAGEVRLTLSVTHNKDRKAFTARLGLHEWRDEGVFITERHDLLNEKHGVYLPSTPCARFSEKALEAAWHNAVAMLRVNGADALAPLDMAVTRIGH